MPAQCSRQNQVSPFVAREARGWSGILGLIDTITTGLRLVLRKPWLVALPVILDLWLLLGPRISVAPVMNGLLRLWSADNLPADFVANMEPYRQMLEQIGASFNLWWLLDNGLTWLQTITPRLNPAIISQNRQPMDMPTWGLLIWTPLILVLGLGLGSAFLTLVAAQVTKLRNAGSDDEVTNPPASFWLRRGLRTWGIVLLYGLVLVALLAALGLVLSLALTPVMILSPQTATALATLLALVIGWAVLWVYLMLYFVVAALVMDGAGLLDALRRSFLVVSRNFWASLGLVILTAVILAGFGFIWQRLVEISPLAVAVAVGGNAVLLTGLVAARLLFYDGRYEALQAPAPAVVKQ